MTHLSFDPVPLAAAPVSVAPPIRSGDRGSVRAAEGVCRAAPSAPLSPLAAFALDVARLAALAAFALALVMWADALVGRG